jgi:septal ring factor EnvC (AmiA/AmiB activator)
LAVDSARKAQRQLEAETAVLAEELRVARSEAAAMAAVVDAGAADVANLERQLRHLTQREIALTEALAARREQTSETLMALQRLARLPPAAVLVRPDTAVDLSRAGAILWTAVAAIGRRAERLEQDLLDLDRTRKATEARRRARERAVAQLRRESEQLGGLIAKTSGLQTQLAIRAWDAAEHGRRLAEQAGDAEVLVSRLRQEEKALAAAIAHHPPPSPSMRPDLRPDPDFHPKPERNRPERNRVERNHKAERAGRSRRASGEPPDAGPGYPTDGRIVASFGESGEGSGASEGITWETVSGARVVAPAPGVVAFAGPFRGYGLLLIIEHVDEYHSLLAGLARIDVAIGQHVRSGDLLGAMEHRSTGNLSLYMELRKNGHPVNPLPWLAAGKRKVSG